MKKAILSLAIVASLVAGPALAQNSGEVVLDLGSLTKDQREALVSILSGLPRQ